MKDDPLLKHVWLPRLEQRSNHVLMLAAVLRELGQQVWQSNIAHSLKQSVHAVSAFSSA